MYDISFHWQFLARVCSIKQEFVWKRKGIPNRRCYPGNWAKYKILHIYFSRLLLNFKSTFKIKKFMNDFWNDFRRTPPMAASTSMFYFAIDYKNEPNMKVAASNVNIKVHQLFSRQRILGVRVIIVHRKTSGNFARTCSWITCRTDLWK